MTPDELRQMAAELDAKAKAALRAGKPAEADALVHAAWKARDLAEQREKQLQGRRKGLQPDILPGMTAAARVRIAKGSRPDRKPTELEVVASFAGHTLRSIAEALECSNVFLTKAAHGTKAIRESWAKSIQEMTRSKEHPNGYAATRRNWPAGWAREPQQ